MIEVAEGAAGPGLVPSGTTHSQPLFSVKFSDREASQARRMARMRKSLWGAAHCFRAALGRSYRAWFVTLTYRDPLGWEPGHVRAFLTRMRAWCAARRLTLHYVWVAELQTRGAMHYHVVLWLPLPFRCPKPDVTGMWAHGMTQTELGIAPVPYLMKYCSKGSASTHAVPKGARIFGVGGLPGDGRLIVSWLNLPGWAQALHGVGEVARKSVGLVVRASGEVLQSPYVCVPVHGGVSLFRMGPVVARWFDGPYSSLEVMP